MDRVLTSILLIDGGIQSKQYTFLINMPPSKTCKWIKRHISWWYLGSLKIKSKSDAGTDLYHIFSKSYLKQCKLTIGEVITEESKPADILKLLPK